MVSARNYSILFYSAVTHGCIIANIRLYVNDVEVPGVEPPVHQVLQIVQVSVRVTLSKSRK